MFNPESFELTLPQELQLKIIEQEAPNLSREEAERLLVEVSRLAMIRENLVKDLLMRNIRGGGV